MNANNLKKSLGTANRVSRIYKNLKVFPIKMMRNSETSLHRNFICLEETHQILNAFFSATIKNQSFDRSIHKAKSFFGMQFSISLTSRLISQTIKEEGKEIQRIAREIRSRDGVSGEKLQQVRENLS